MIINKNEERGLPMKKREKNRYYELVAGYMYIICMITSIGGGQLLTNILSKGNISLSLEHNATLLIIATILDLINAFGVLAIAICFHTMLKRTRPAMASTYLILRSIEVAFCIVISYVPIMALTSIHTINMSSKTHTEWIFILFSFRSVFWAYVYPILFVISGIFFYSMLYSTKILPRYISLWGLISLIGVLIAILVPDIKMIPGLAIIANELYLGFYLLLKKSPINTNMLQQS